MERWDIYLESEINQDYHMMLRDLALLVIVLKKITIEWENKTLKKFLYAFILGLCFSVLYSYILHPIHLTVKYGDKVKEILEQKYSSESNDSWILVHGKTKYVLHGVILNTGQSFLIEDIEFIKYILDL